MMHNKAFTVAPARKHATQSTVKISGFNMSLTEVRLNGSVVSVGPEFYHGFPGSYQADSLSFFKIFCEFIYF